MRQSFLIFTFFMTAFSCNKVDTSHIATPASEYFPNTIGDYWKYKYVDSVSNKSGLVEVNIVGNTVLANGQNAKIWRYVYPDHVDTNFVYQVGDTIRFVGTNLTLYNRYIIPLVLNNKWTTLPDFTFDSIRVIENKIYNLSGQNFSNSFLLNENGWLPNQFWGRKEWFSPYIGMITNNETGLFTLLNERTNIYWQLLEYDLK